MSKLAMIAALVAMMGGQWALLQSIAWMGMLVDYSRAGSIATAVSETFDGKHPCPLCKAIAAGKKSEQKRPAAFHAQKLEFPPAPENLALSEPPQFEAPSHAPARFKTHLQRPPVPPPRGFPG